MSALKEARGVVVYDTIRQRCPVDRVEEAVLFDDLADGKVSTKRRVVNCRYVISNRGVHSFGVVNVA